MNASNIETGWWGVVIPVDVAGERDSRHVHICAGRCGTVRLVDHRVGKLQVRVERQDGVDILKGYHEEI